MSKISINSDLSASPDANSTVRATLVIASTFQINKTEFLSSHCVYKW